MSAIKCLNLHWCFNYQCSPLYSAQSTSSRETKAKVVGSGFVFFCPVSVFSAVAVSSSGNGSLKSSNLGSDFTDGLVFMIKEPIAKEDDHYFAAKAATTSLFMSCEETPSSCQQPSRRCQPPRQRGENNTFLLSDPQAATLQRRGPNFMCQMLAVFSTTKLNSLVDYKRLWKASRKTPCFGIAPFPPRALICKFLKEGKPEKLRMEDSTEKTSVR